MRVGAPLPPGAPTLISRRNYDTRRRLEIKGASRLRPGKIIYRLFHQRSAKRCFTREATGLWSVVSLGKHPAVSLGKRPRASSGRFIRVFFIMVMMRIESPRWFEDVLHEIETPQRDGVGSTDLGDEVSFVDDRDQSLILQVNKCSARGCLAATASEGRLSDAERKRAVVVSVTFAEEQQEHRDIDRVECRECRAVVDDLGQHDERLMLAHGWPGFSTSSQSMPTSGGRWTSTGRCLAKTRFASA